MREKNNILLYKSFFMVIIISVDSAVEIGNYQGIGTQKTKKNPNAVSEELESGNIIQGSKLSLTLKKELENTRLSLDEYLVAAAKRRSNKVVMMDVINHQSLTTEDFLGKSHSLAAELQELGAKKDTVIGIMADNRIEYPVVILAILLTGATFTGFDPNYSVEDFQPIVDITKPSMIFCSVEHCDKVKPAIPPTTKIIIFDSMTHPLSNDNGLYLKFSQLAASTKTLKKIKNSPDDLAGILYSSGTTGLEKGIMVTHKNIVYSLILLNECVITNNGSKLVIVTPMCHCSGLSMGLAGLIRDEMILLTDTRDMRVYLSTIQDHEVKTVLLLRNMLTFLLKNPIAQEYDLSKVENVIYGVAPPGSDEALRTKFKFKYIQQMYAMTEAFYVTITPREGKKEGSCGAPLPGIEMKVVDMQTGKTLSKNKPGEICVRGPTVMKGYYNNEEATSGIIDQDGWLRSGDIGFYDEDGDFFLVDRVKELIKCFKTSEHEAKQLNGIIDDDFNIVPGELEKILMEHPQILDVAVIGIPDKDEPDAELPRAYVVLQDKAKLTEEDVEKYLADKVTLNKQLQGGVEIIDEIPKTSTGKVARKKLREMWSKRVQQQIPEQVPERIPEPVTKQIPVLVN